MEGLAGRAVTAVRQVSLRTRLDALEHDLAQAKRDHVLKPHWEDERARVQAELKSLREQLQAPIVRHGIDFAYGAPHPALLKAVGISFVCRYYSPDPQKNLTRPQAEDLSQAGISIVSVWESAAQASLGGHAAGVADAEAAKRMAHAIGQPASTPIFFAVDYELQQGQKDLVEGYLRGACDAIGKDRVGVYGGLATVELSYVRGVADYRWQTLAWSGTPTVWYQHAHLRQIANGVSVAGIIIETS